MSKNSRDAGSGGSNSTIPDSRFSIPEKNGRPAHPGVITGRPTHWLPGARGFTPAVLLPIAIRRLIGSALGRSGAPASIPQRLGRAARFAGAGAAVDQVADRPSALHAGAPRRRGRGTRLASPARVDAITRIVRRLGPCCQAASPEFSLRRVTRGVAGTARSPPFPHTTGAQDKRLIKSRKCRCFFGLRDSVWGTCGSLTS